MKNKTMKLMRSEDILTRPISDIIEPDWDIRNSHEDEAGIVALANSIKKDGFINPITCIKFGKKYKIIAGRRRFKAAKMIGLKEIPIYVKNDIDAEVDSRRVALIENCHRKDMVGSERAHGFFEVYKMAGYTKEQVIKGVKSIDNWFNDNNKNKTDWDLFTHKSFMGDKNPRASQLLYDKQFVEICKDIGFAPKYQYQLMQLVVQLKPEVLKDAENQGLAIDHQILLTTRPLRDHPIIQKELIHEIKNDLPRKSVHSRVKQVAKDLETGYLKLEGNHYVKGDSKNREIVKGGDKVLEPIQVAHMDITKSINEFLFRVTNRSITHGEFEYSKKIIDNTKDYRLSVIKVADKRTLQNFEKDLMLVADVVLEVLELIKQESDSRDMKKDMEMK